jgi:tetratricopeptide (TPR) repeat protein
MHDLVRLFATEEAEHLTEAARTDALRRVVDFYLHSLAIADHVVEPVKPRIELREPVAGCVPHVPDGADAALRWFDAEHACLSAAVGLAGKLGWHTEVWQLAFLLNDLRRRRGHVLESLADAKLALASAELLGDPVALLLAHRHFASAAIIAGRHHLARTTLPEAMALAERVGDVHQLAALHYVMGGVKEYDGDFAAELDHARRVLELIDPEVDPRLTLRAHNMIGFCHASLGDLAAARRHLLHSSALAREYGNLDCEAFAEGNLSSVAYKAGDHARSVEHGVRAVEIFDACGDLRGAAFFATNLGESYRALGDHEQSRQMLYRARDYYTAHQPDSPELGRIETELAALSS